VCIISSENKLSPDAPEYTPSIYSVQTETTICCFDLSKKDFDTDDDMSISDYKKGHASTSREFQCSDSNSEPDSYSENTSGCITETSQSESDSETCYEESYSNFSEAFQVSENNESYASEPETLHKENDIIFCSSEVTSDILNRVIAPQKSTTEVVICPDFQNLGLMVKSSSKKPIARVLFEKTKNPNSLKDRLSWQQKRRWPQTNQVFDCMAVNTGRGSKKKTHKNFSTRA